MNAPTLLPRLSRAMRSPVLATLICTLLPVSGARADLITTTSGRSIVCIIEREAEGRVHFETERGNGTIPRKAIQEMQRASADENARLRQQWAGADALPPEGTIEASPLVPAPSTKALPRGERERIPWTKAGPSDDPTAQTDLNAKVEPVYEDNFVEVVLKSEQPVLVSFAATWCPACRMQDPVVEQMAFELHGKMQFVRLDVDGNPRVARYYGVRKLPTLMIFEEGEKQSVFVGYHAANRLRPILKASVIKGGPDHRRRW